MKAFQIEEVQGLYGPFTLSERVIQKIWLRQDFDKVGLRTASGKILEVLDPGRWNLLDGPDFKEARLRIGGVELIGDVEVHFNTSDWIAHAHDQNPAFNQVVLHLVLYPGAVKERPVYTKSGNVPELIVLLPLLNRDMEGYAFDDALRELERVDELEWVTGFLQLPIAERQRSVAEQAKLRWRQKLHYVRKRLDAVGWEAACHQLCLEVLGYSRNRAPMARIALQHPIGTFRSGGLDTESLFSLEAAHWRIAGLRPANQPKLRLAQYLQMVAHAPDWPERLRAKLNKLPESSAEEASANFRRRMGLRALFDDLRDDLFAGALGERRSHTLIVDAFLPLATAEGFLDAYPYWTHWWPGDAPEALNRFLKKAELTHRQSPLSNGLIQGALGLSVARGD